ncbi:hypothetical protein GE09DRAFT_419941 [Coniochaeta sp. 2T2.1]|nr:hypothetical protein GE09DRAFT_419941 [Coniochaeta sp. 2T2.1]
MCQWVTSSLVSFCSLLERELLESMTIGCTFATPDALADYLHILCRLDRQGEHTTSKPPRYHPRGMGSAASCRCGVAGRESSWPRSEPESHSA